MEHLRDPRLGPAGLPPKSTECRDARLTGVARPRGSGNMKRLFIIVLAVAAIPAALWISSCGHRAGLSGLRVIYAGDPGTPQTASFRKLLAEHVKSVTVIPVLDLAKADLSKADVLIIGGDKMKNVDGKVHMQPGPTGLTLNMLPIPTVLIGGMGAGVADQLDLKLGWRHG
jgi:hypothetical protein